MQATAANRATSASRQLDQGHLIKQVRFGPAMKGCCGLRRVLELRVFPAAEGGLGQEPLA